MTTILTVTLPFFAVIACGYLADRFGVLTAASRVGLNNFVFYFSLPVLLFSLMAHSDLSASFDWGICRCLFAGVIESVWRHGLAGTTLVRFE